MVCKQYVAAFRADGTTLRPAVQRALEYYGVSFKLDEWTKQRNKVFGFGQSWSTQSTTSFLDKNVVEKVYLLLTPANNGCKVQHEATIVYGMTRFAV